MATHEGERYLAPQLDSLCAQRLLPAELVACDDASTDATLEILTEFSGRSPFPVRIVRQPARVGHARTFFEAAAACHGEAVAFCDQDDVWQPEKLELCAAALADPGVMLVVHRSTPVDAGLRPLARAWPHVPHSRTDPPLRHGALDTFHPGMAMVVRRRLLTGEAARQRPPTRYAGGGPMHHDEFAQFMANALGGIRLIDRSLVLYRQHPSNIAGLPVAGRRRLVCDLGHYERTAALCEQYADWLAAAPVSGAQAVRRCQRAAAAYGEAALLWRARAALHGQHSRRHRMREFVAIAARGGYRARERCGLGGVPSAGKDLAAALLPRAAWQTVPTN